MGSEGQDSEHLDLAFRLQKKEFLGRNDAVKKVYFDCFLSLSL